MRIDRSRVKIVFGQFLMCSSFFERYEEMWRNEVAFMDVRGPQWFTVKWGPEVPRRTRRESLLSTAVRRRTYVELFWVSQLRRRHRLRTRSLSLSLAVSLFLVLHPPFFLFFHSLSMTILRGIDRLLVPSTPFSFHLARSQNHYTNLSINSAHKWIKKILEVKTKLFLIFSHGSFENSVKIHTLSTIVEQPFTLNHELLNSCRKKKTKNGFFV